jgi:ATP-binding cassette subfamily C protein
VGFKRTQAIAGFVYQVATAAALAGLVWIGFEVVSVPTAQLLALIVVMSRILPIPGGVADSFRGAANMLPAYEQAMATLDEAHAAAERPVVPSERHPISEAIDLDHIRFAYPQAARPAIDDVTLRLPAHTTTALVGPSGAGKTTLADIVLGLLAPDDGEIRVDGQALNTIELGSWRAAISYVPQDPFLFHESLRDNVRWGTNGVGDAAVVELLQTVGLGQLLANLPEGLDTIVGERGHRLSGGERQRVVLARALARQPHLLVLDEATSHLDAENEQAVRAAIDALHGELTVLVIAHRLGTVRHADQIVVLENGRLCESGSWEDLVSRRGRFSELVLAGDVPG